MGHASSTAARFHTAASMIIRRAAAVLSRQKCIVEQPQYETVPETHFLSEIMLPAANLEGQAKEREARHIATQVHQDFFSR